ncbi:MAG TPA: ORF6N domain-containing protein [Verrucomicrobiae bacterium]|nr:ORF6N domain-containing protein [Verrucomicrobiae bacterium]
MGYKAELIRPPQIEQAILLIRGQRVMLDRDLAAMYGVSTGNLNKAVQRNLDRFPADFMFRLTAEEARASRFQIGILKRGLNIKYLPYVFTQEGVDSKRLVPQARHLCRPIQQEISSSVGAASSGNFAPAELASFSII